MVGVYKRVGKRRTTWTVKVWAGGSRINGGTFHDRSIAEERAAGIKEKYAKPRPFGYIQKRYNRYYVTKRFGTNSPKSRATEIKVGSFSSCREAEMALAALYEQVEGRHYEHIRGGV